MGCYWLFFWGLKYSVSPLSHTETRSHSVATIVVRKVAPENLEAGEEVQVVLKQDALHDREASRTGSSGAETDKVCSDAYGFGESKSTDIKCRYDAGKDITSSWA